METRNKLQPTSWDYLEIHPNECDILLITFNAIILLLYNLEIKLNGNIVIKVAQAIITVLIIP